MRVISLFVLCLIFISGCNNEEIVSINIPNVDDYTVLYVQGVDKNGVVSESTSKYITDDKKINSFINKVNKMKVIKPSSKEIIMKGKELNKQGNYLVALADSINMDNKLYYMILFKDGSIEFQQEDKKVIKYLSKEKQPELLEELKKLLDINF